MFYYLRDLDGFSDRDPILSCVFPTERGRNAVSEFYYIILFLEKYKYITIMM